MRKGLFFAGMLMLLLGSRVVDDGDDDDDDGDDMEIRVGNDADRER